MTLGSSDDEQGIAVQQLGHPTDSSLHVEAQSASDWQKCFEEGRRIDW
jgi:hypothetical protein